MLKFTYFERIFTDPWFVYVTSPPARLLPLLAGVEVLGKLKRLMAALLPFASAMPSRSSMIRVCLFYLLAILGCSLILVLSLGLWNANFKVPFYYEHGRDVNFMLGMCKFINDTGWFTQNPMMSAPGTMELYDFPCDAGIYSRMKLFNMLTHDPFLTTNLLYLTTFPLVTCTSLYSFRELGLRWPSAMAASLLYCLTPYHYWRATQHPMFTAYEAIPLIVLVALRISGGNCLFISESKECKRATGLRPSKGLLEAILVTVFVSLSGIYFAYFGVLLLSIAGLIAAVRRWSWRPLLDVAVSITLIMVSLSIQLAPCLIHAYRYGLNQKLVGRDETDYSSYGLRLNNMVVPSAWHRLNCLAQLSPAYPWKDVDGRGFLDQNEAVGSTPLGLLGTTGLVTLLIAGISSPAWLNRRLPSLANAARVTTAILLFALMGGGSEVVAIHITQVFRGINRMSIIILFMCLLAIGLIVDQTLQARKSLLVRAVVLAGAILALLDQIPSGIAPDYARDIAAFRADENFVRKIESSVAPNAKVLQLPVVWFPSFGRVCQMKDYNHMRGYLHSDQIHWSYGAMPERSTYRWQLGVAALPASQMVTKLTIAGFDGIYINTTGYEDGALALIDQLRRQLGTEPLSGGSKGELRFFRLPTGKSVSPTRRGLSRGKLDVGEQP